MSSTTLAFSSSTDAMCDITVASPRLFSSALVLCVFVTARQFVREAHSIDMLFGFLLFCYTRWSLACRPHHAPFTTGVVVVVVGVDGGCVAAIRTSICTVYLEVVSAEDRSVSLEIVGQCDVLVAIVLFHVSRISSA